MTTNTQIFVNIRTCVEEDDLPTAIAFLCMLTDSPDHNARNEVSALRGRLSRLEKELRMSTLKYEEISSEKTKIALAILSLLDFIRGNDFPSTTSNLLSIS